MACYPIIGLFTTDHQLDILHLRSLLLNYTASEHCVCSAQCYLFQEESVKQLHHLYGDVHGKLYDSVDRH